MRGLKFLFLVGLTAAAFLAILDLTGIWGVWNSFANWVYAQSLPMKMLIGFGVGAIVNIPLAIIVQKNQPFVFGVGGNGANKQAIRDAFRYGRDSQTGEPIKSLTQIRQDLRNEVAADDIAY